MARQDELGVVLKRAAKGATFIHSIECADEVVVELFDRFVSLIFTQDGVLGLFRIDDREVDRTLLQVLSKELGARDS